MIISNPVYLAALDAAIDAREAALDEANKTYAANWKRDHSAARKARVDAYSAAHKEFDAACGMAADAMFCNAAKE